MTLLRTIKDQTDQEGMPALQVSAYNDARVLAASAAEVYTVPAGISFLVLTTSGSDIWVKPGGAAAIPAADVSDGTASILIPAGVSRIVDVGHVATVGLIAALPCAVSIECYQKRGN